MASHFFYSSIHLLSSTTLLVLIFSFTTQRYKNSGEDTRAKNSVKSPKSEVVTSNGSTKILSKDLLVFEIIPKAGQRIWHTGYPLLERERGGGGGGGGGEWKERRGGRGER